MAIPPVVVGVVDDGTTDDALDWATAEAATRGVPLRIVHALRPSLPAVGYGAFAPVDTVAGPQRPEHRVLRDAVARTRSVASDIEVQTALVAGPAARALRDEARDAQLLVLGGRGRSNLTAPLHGSVAACVTRLCPCPVVLVHPVPVAGPPGRDPDRSSSRVVVGVDPTSPNSATVGFAVDAARQRGVPITAVSAWTPDRAADIETIPGPPALSEATAGQALERALLPWREQFPTLTVTPKLVCAEPAQALISESTGAALLVIGARDRPRLRRLLLGSISHTVRRHARCPTAVIRDARRRRGPRERSPAESGR